MPKRRLALSSLAAVAVLVATSAGLPAEAKPRDDKRDAYTLTTRKPGPAVMAVISLDNQRVTVYDKDGPILGASVSSGQTNYETPVGIYSILQKKADHTSNIYKGAAMPHMQRITWSGVALHGGALPGYPASHGCVRLPFKFAKRVFDLTDLGTRVIVARGNVAPVAISHPLLFKRTPYRSEAGLVTKAAAVVGNMLGQAEEPGNSGEPADVAARAAALEAVVTAKRAEAEAIEAKAEPARALAKKLEPANKRAEKVLRKAEKAVQRATDRVVKADRALARAKSEKSQARAEARKAKADAKLTEAQAKYEEVLADVQPKIDAYREAAGALKALEEERDAARAEASDAERKLSPVKVFVSLKTQKLYVRQGLQPVFETPVTIADPHTPIGTHTYTAVDYGKDGREMRWNVVSIAGGQRGGYDNYYDRGYDYDHDYDDDYYDDYDYYYDRPRRRRAKASKSKEPKPTDLAKATAALDRITVPPEAAARISELVLPGTSLIVSDEEASKETGKQTGFVVLISGEPQGAIKKRRRDPYYDDYSGYYDDYYDRRRRRRSSGGPFGGPFFRW